MDCRGGWSVQGKTGKIIVAFENTTTADMMAVFYAYKNYSCSLDINKQATLKLSISISEVVADSAIYRIWLE